MVKPDPPTPRRIEKKLGLNPGFQHQDNLCFEGPRNTVWTPKSLHCSRILDSCTGRFEERVYFYIGPTYNHVDIPGLLRPASLGHLTAYLPALRKGTYIHTSLP